MNTAKTSSPKAPGVPWGWAAAGAIIGGLLCLLAVLPARWAGALATRASGERVLLQDVRGSVWNGSAQLVLAGGAGSRDAKALPGRLSWQLRPRWNAALPAPDTNVPQGSGTNLRAAGMNASLQHSSCEQSNVQLSWLPFNSVFQLSGLDCQLPAQMLAGLGTPWNTLGFDGSVKLSSSFLQWPLHADAGSLRGALELQALSLSSRLSTLRPLGSYRVRLSGQDAAPGLQLELATTEGALRLVGQGQQLAGRWRFQGQAQAEPGQYPVLANILNLIGNRGGDIAWHVLRPPAP
ncbi:type II secretion system protein N [Pantoea sp. 18069]|uniref:type II secretion system protein N n=1 Tax=Pantoea sp. 18069 TaxID=2681415 RepID=UPI00190F599B|nr:type II secretion system protein N [Pantoea sp. 18069]